MIMQLILIFTITVIALVAGEYARHRLDLDNEFSRKLVHVLHASTLTALIFVAPITVIIILELAFLGLVTTARYVFEHQSARRHTFWAQYLREMYKVGRASYGEFFFPVSVIMIAMLAQTPWIFAASVLCLGWADTIAALVGKRYGRRSMYTILGQKKSVLGSVAFFAVAFMIVGFVGMAAGAHIPWAAYLWVPFALTIAENIGVYGTDNFLIPLIATVALNAAA